MREFSIHEIGDRRNSIVVSTYRIDNRETRCSIPGYGWGILSIYFVFLSLCFCLIFDVYFHSLGFDVNLALLPLLLNMFVDG